MRALVIGAGAVGQVFALHLVRGGAEVALFVKPKYADECARGYTLYKLRGGQADRLAVPARTSWDDVARERWDQVYVTVATPALPALLPELARATGDATIVVLQPGVETSALVEQSLAAERVVHGTIGFLSYHAPLPGETRFTEPGMAYYHFPGGSPFSGDAARADAVVAALRAGGMPVRRVADVKSVSAYASAVLDMFVLALEASGWSLAEMRRTGLASLGARAAAEAIAIARRATGTKPPLAVRLLARPLGFRAMMRLVPLVSPVAFEPYMQAHFTKVRDQMHEEMGALLDRGKATGAATARIEELSKRLGQGPQR